MASRGIVAFAADGERWAWLNETAETAQLFAGGPGGGAPRLLGEGRGWTEVALAGQDAWVLQQEGQKGQLLSVGLQGGDAPETVLAGMESPAGLRASEGRLFWIEMTPAASPLFSFVPPAGPQARVRCREAAGEIRDCGAPYPAGPVEAEPRHQVIGATADTVYVAIRRLIATDFVRVPLAPGSAPTRLAAENGGGQGAALSGGSLYWTAPSEEATPNSSFLCVRRAPAGRGSEPPGRVETVTDWLPGGGFVFSAGDQVYYVSEALFRVPGPARRAPAAPEYVRPVPPARVTTDGRSLVLIGNRPAPAAIPLRPE